MSESGDDGRDKPFEASQARLDKARADGDVPQSRELTAAAAYAGLVAAVVLFGGQGAQQFSLALSRFFEDPAYFADRFSGGVHPLAVLMRTPAVRPAALLVLPGLGALGALIAQRAIAPSFAKLKPKLSRLSLAANAKKKFGPEGLGEFVKSAVKLVIVMTLFAALFAARLPNWPALASQPPAGVAQTLQHETTLFLGLILLFSIALAALDFPWTQHLYRKRMRMSLEEVRRESKEQEGDAAMKQNRRERAQALATNKMLADVPSADVVIVNPLHYAVALKWNRDKLGAPICIAKGADIVAARIRERAAATSVPIKSDPPTARALFASIEIGEEVPREHYAAVAAAIYFADAMRKKARRT